MNTIFEATVVNGQVVLPGDVYLPKNSKVLVIVPGEIREDAGRIRSPRLAHPDQVGEFLMDVREIADAGVC